MSRFLDPAVLGAMSGLDLVARTVVDGFVAGLHRSADFGFSQEFAEYRAYTPGDDPAQRRLECVRAYRSYLREALSGGDQQSGHDVAGCEQLDELCLPFRQQDELCAVHGGGHLLSGHPQAA